MSFTTLKFIVCYITRWQDAKKVKLANEFLGLKKLKSNLEDVSMSSECHSHQEMENYINYISNWKHKHKGKTVVSTCKK